MVLPLVGFFWNTPRVSLWVFQKSPMGAMGPLEGIPK